MSTHSATPAIQREEWISQTQAARLRKVTKQAISKLVKKGRIRSIEVGGHVLVSREDVEKFKPKPAGRPARGKRG